MVSLRRMSPQSNGKTIPSLELLERHGRQAGNYRSWELRGKTAPEGREGSTGLDVGRLR